jgi:hypothetical protein
VLVSYPIQTLEGDTAVTYEPSASTGCGMLTACHALPFQRYAVATCLRPEYEYPDTQTLLAADADIPSGMKLMSSGK